MKKAWIIVDLVNDFVTGKFGSDDAVRVAEKTGELLSLLQGRVPVVFTLDSHVLDDPEFKIWGEHCLAGTEASELCQQVSKFNGYRVHKRRYDAFLDTDLDPYLRMHDIKEIYLSGVSTDICVAHTAAGAFFRYYTVNVIEDLCASLNPADHEGAVKSMKKYYGARIINHSQFKAEVV